MKLCHISVAVRFFVTQCIYHFTQNY